MNMNILSAFVLGLALSASAVAESLPVIAVKPHAVDLTFPSEAVVEAIQFATKAGTGFVFGFIGGGTDVPFAITNPAAMGNFAFDQAVARRREALRALQ